MGFSAGGQVTVAEGGGAIGRLDDADGAPLGTVALAGVAVAAGAAEDHSLIVAARGAVNFVIVCATADTGYDLHGSSTGFEVPPV